MGYIEIIKAALKEDVGTGDITTNAIVARDKIAKAVIRAKEAGVIAGIDIAREVFRQIDCRIKFIPKCRDGQLVKAGTILAELSGPARGILTGERVALNFLQHLSGVSTLTAKFVAKVQGPLSMVKVLDTRKTIPGLRSLEKYAVKCGGGTNHRMGLYDAVLIKDNHIALAGGVKEAIEAVEGQGKARKGKGRWRGLRAEIEAKTIGEVKEAIEVGAGRILLDNMEIKTLRQAVKLCKEAGIKTEASGGVNLKTVAKIAATGVDFISIGELTHSSKALDINLKLV
ncbi:MAG: carboxylating nicotinate-nucleotide diphosphorylase [Candidatus Margulisiibacteriota bacterium]